MAKPTLRASSDTSIKLSPFRKKDLASLVLLEKRLFPIDKWSKDDFLEELQNDANSIKVLRDGERVIGYVHTEVRKRKVRTGKIVRIGEIGSIAVDRKYRGKRLGERLVRSGIRRLQRIDADKIIIHTRVDNIPMQRLAN